MYRRYDTKGKKIMMSKRNFACIMTAKETATKIKELTDEVKVIGVTKAYKNLKKIAEINDRFVAQFGNTDPNWSPKNTEIKYIMSKKNFACIMTAKETAAAIKELTDAATKVTMAYKTVHAIAEINDKFIADFGDVDPSWSPKKEQQIPTRPVEPMTAYAYEEAYE